MHSLAIATMDRHHAQGTELSGSCQMHIHTHATKDLSQAGFPVHPEQLDAGVFTHYEYLERISPPIAQDRLTVVVFNMMRGTFLEESIQRIQETITPEPDILLASELDIGMVRSGNRHVAREVAAALEMNYAFGVEFVELSLGDDLERQLPGENSVGLHGNAIFSRYPLEAISLVRLPRYHDWYTDSQKRIGSRVAVVARLGGTALTVVSVHLENFTTPIGRLRQTLRMLEAVDGPALIGGDFNTLGFADPHPTFVDPRSGFDPLDPIAAEPLFHALDRRGFLHEPANAPRVPTTPDGKKIDWVFVRSIKVVAGSPTVVPAIGLLDPQQRISDHDILTLTIELM